MINTFPTVERTFVTRLKIHTYNTFAGCENTAEFSSLSKNDLHLQVSGEHFSQFIKQNYAWAAYIIQSCYS